MNRFLKYVAAGALALLPATGFAATLQPGTYEAIDYNGVRSIWTPSNAPIIAGGGAGATWSFGSDARFEFDGSHASLKGTATNVGNANLQFEVSFKYKLEGVGTQSGFCQQVSFGDCSGVGVDPSQWTFFDLVDGMFTGIGALAGINFDVYTDTRHDPQAGIGGNALDFDLGFSQWFDYSLTSDSYDAARNSGFYVRRHGDGDVNIDLAPVPLPAAGWLLLAGIGGLSVASRRKKKAA